MAELPRETLSQITPFSEGVGASSNGGESARMLSRRIMLRGSLWAAGATGIAVAAPAPAFAASPCDITYSGKVTFSGGGNYTRTSTTSGSATVVPTPTTEPVVVTFNSVYTNNYILHSDNLLNNGYIPNTLQLYQQRRGLRPDPDSGTGQILTITFSRPVTNLVFDLFDVTYYDTTATGSNIVGYRDVVWFSIPPSSYSAGSWIEGNGYTTPFYSSQLGYDTLPQNQVTDITFPAPTTTLVVHFYDAFYTDSSPDNYHLVALSEMTFDVKGEGCA